RSSLSLHTYSHGELSTPFLPSFRIRAMTGSALRNKRPKTGRLNNLCVPSSGIAIHESRPRAEFVSPDHRGVIGGFKPQVQQRIIKSRHELSGGEPWKRWKTKNVSHFPTARLRRSI